jgi:hypothetical protein
MEWKRLVVFGGSRDHLAAMLRDQTLSVGSAVYPVFGQQAVDLGFKSVVALPRESNPKSRTLRTPPLARAVAKLLNASSR